MPTRYAEIQTARDAAYDRAYREWVTSLGFEDRVALANEGLDVPDLAPAKASQVDPSIALMLVGTRDRSPDENDHESKQPSTISDSGQDAAAAIASFCARIRSHPSPLLAFDAACYAAGLMEVEGWSESALARRHRVTRGAFNKAVIQFADTFGLSPSQGMRSKCARRAHRRARMEYLDNGGRV